MKNRDRVEIIRIVGTRYRTLLQKKVSQRSSRPPEQAFFSSESGVRSGAGRGRGRGGSSSKGGGRSSGGGNNSASRASGSSHGGGGSRPSGRCWRCNSRGHIREEYTTKKSDFIAECARCSEESTCSSDRRWWRWSCRCQKGILPWKLRRSWQRKQASAMVGEEAEGGELGKQVVQHIGDRQHAT